MEEKEEKTNQNSHTIIVNTIIENSNKDNDKSNENKSSNNEKEEKNTNSFIEFLKELIRKYFVFIVVVIIALSGGGFFFNSNYFGSVPKEKPKTEKKHDSISKSSEPSNNAKKEVEKTGSKGKTKTIATKRKNTPTENTPTEKENIEKISDKVYENQ